MPKTPRRVRPLAPHLRSHSAPPYPYDSSSSSAGKTAVDKAAANRFIKHAIAQVREQATTSTTTSSANTNTNTHIRFDAHGNATMPTPSSFSASTSASASASASASSSSAAAIPAKVTSKMRARAEWQKKIAEEDHDEDEEDADALQVFDEDNEGDEGEGSSGPEQASFKGKDKGKGKTKAAEEDTAVGGKKRRRPAVDPFAGESVRLVFLLLRPPSQSWYVRTGYGDDAEPKASKSLKKKNSLTPQAEGDDVAMDDASASGNATPRSSKKDKKVRKKSKKAS